MKNNIFSLSTCHLLLITYYLLLSTSLYAVEGNKPVPELELPVLEVKISEDSLQVVYGRGEVTSPLHFSQFSLGLEFGESELGEGYNIEIGGYTGINNLFTAQFLEVDDKSSFGAGTELRVISCQSITEIDVKTRRYKIGDGYWENLYLANSSISLYLGKNIFKVFTSVCYESESLWDIGVLWSRRFWQPLFIGVGISAPIVAPFVQIDWRVNDLLSINISHRSKTVTRPLESIYMNQPYVIQNPDLKHEHWNYFSDIKFLLGDNTTVEISYKEVEHGISFCSYEFVKPLNFKRWKEWEGYIDFILWEIKGKTFLKYRPSEVIYLPKFSFVHDFEISFPYDIRIELKNKYTGERPFLFRIFGPNQDCLLSSYWLFSSKLSKKLRNWELWIKINNLTNTKYEVIKEVEESGRCIQAGFTIKMNDKCQSPNIK